MPVFTLSDDLELQEVPAKPEPPDAKLVTYSEKPWVVVVAPDIEDHPEFTSVYGPFLSRDEAAEAIGKLVVFTPYHICQCEDL